MSEPWPPTPPSNPPGLTALAYRVSDFATTKRRLLDGLHRHLLPGGPTLAKLKTRDLDDAAIALMDAWAIVIDVLSFYQERIANEGYWNTATERRSLLELARSLGCELKPGVAASTYLVFKVEETTGTPDSVTVPIGTQIASIPGQGEQSQTFETIAPLIARRDWNALRPRPTRPPSITTATQHLQLQGLPQLQVGDRLLLLDQQPAAKNTPQPALLTLTTVETTPLTGQTRITWEPQSRQATLQHPLVLAFRQRAALFGHLAPKWETLPVEIKRQYSPIVGGLFRQTPTGWMALNTGLPLLDIRCLTVNPVTHTLFAGTAGGGIFRLERTATWTAVNTGLTNLTIEALYSTPEGHLLAGSPGGGVFRSKDNGDTWTPIGLGSIEVIQTQTTTDNKQKITSQSVNWGIPNTVVRALLSYEVTLSLGGSSQQISYLFAGCDNGVYRSQDQGQIWKPLKDQNMPARMVRALLAVRIRETIKPKSSAQFQSAAATAVPKPAATLKASSAPSSTPSPAPKPALSATPAPTPAPAPSAAPTARSVLPAQDSNTPFDDVAHAIARGQLSSPALPHEPNQLTAAWRRMGSAFRQLFNRPPAANTLGLAAASNTSSNAYPGATRAAQPASPGSATEPSQASDASAPSPGQNSASSAPDSEVAASNANPGAMASTSAAPNSAPVPEESVPEESVPEESASNEPASEEPEETVDALGTVDAFTPQPLAPDPPLSIRIVQLLLAGTDRGVYQSHDNGDTWQLVLHNQEITALASDGHNPATYVFAGTRQNGVFRREVPSGHWMQINTGLTNLSITALQQVGTTLFAGTTGGRIFQLTIDGLTWTEVPTEPFTTDVTALEAAGRDLFVGTRFGGFRDTDWPAGGKALESEVGAAQPGTASTASGTNTVINLDAVYPKLLKRSWMVLIDGDRIQPCQVREANTVLLQGFTLETQVTQVTPQIPFDVSPFNPQTTVVLLYSEALELATEMLTVQTQGLQIFQDPIARNTIFLEQFVQGLQPGQPLIVSGKRLRVQIQTVGGLFRRIAADDRWRRFNSGLANLAVQALTLTPYGEVFAGTEQGLFRWQHDLLGGDRWQRVESVTSAGTALADQSIQVLLASSAYLLIGTEKGLFCLSSNNNLLEQCDQGLTNTNLRALAVNADQDWFAGTENGVFRRRQGGEVAGTENGVFRYCQEGKGWEPINQDLTDTRIQALAIDALQHVFVGTATGGVFRSLYSPNGGITWELVGYSGKAGMGAIASTDTTVYGTGTRFDETLKPGMLLSAAGQTRRVIQLDSDRPTTVLMIDHPFSPNLPEGTPFSVGTGLTNPKITALVTYVRHGTGHISSAGTTVTGSDTDFLGELQEGDVITAAGQTRIVTQIMTDEDGTVTLILNEAFSSTLNQQPFTLNVLLAGTAGSGIFRSSSQGDRWQAINQGLTQLEITTLSADRQPGVGRLTSSGTSVEATQAPLLQVGALITAGNQTRRVTAITGDRSFTVNVAFDPPLKNSPYTVFVLLAGTAQSDLFRSLDEGASWVRFNQGCVNTAIRAIAQIPAGPNAEVPTLLVGGTGILPALDGLSQVAIKPGDRLQVVTPPATASDASRQWHLLDINGFQGVLTTTTDTDLVLQPAEAADDPVSELSHLLLPPDEQRNPMLVLQSDLGNSYDPATLTLHANVVLATHGERINEIEEILGSGDGTLPNQRFVLKKPPLTYVSSADADGSDSTLQIRVNGLLWREVPALYGLQPADEVYIVRREDDGTTIVTFGDGINGARLPTGEDNIVATYRSGSGLAGNVDAGKLTALKTRPLGIGTVTNPFPASGGADPEASEAIRSRAPRSVRTLERIVSRRDLEDFARNFAGIGKAKVSTFWCGSQQVTHLTIAAASREEIRSDAPLHTNLVQAIAAAQDPYQPAPIVASYQRLWFRLAATLLVNPRYKSADVQTRVAAALKAHFAFDRRDFGQAVTAAEAIAVMQAIEGVIAVDLDALHRFDAPRTLEQSLPAALASWNETLKTFQPAQLLLLHSSALQVREVST